MLTENCDEWYRCDIPHRMLSVPVSKDFVYGMNAKNILSVCKYEGKAVTLISA
jgi:hypothetical protein